jgi:hypothetical protein
VYSAPLWNLSSAETVVRAVRLAAKHQRQRQRPGSSIDTTARGGGIGALPSEPAPQQKQMIAFLSLGGDGASDPVELLAAAHELFAAAAAPAAAGAGGGGGYGVPAAPRVLNVGLEIHPLREGPDSTNDSAGHDEGVHSQGPHRMTESGRGNTTRSCPSHAVAAVWRSVIRFGFEARALKSPATDRAGLFSTHTSTPGTSDHGGSGNIGGGALVAPGWFLPLRTEADVRALVAAAAACACPAYLWLATPDPLVPAMDRGDPEARAAADTAPDEAQIAATTALTLRAQHTQVRLVYVAPSQNLEAWTQNLEA